MLTDFEDALIIAYHEAPCGVLPNALWKTQHTLASPDIVTSYSADARGAVDHLLAHDREHLWICWSRDGELPELDPALVQTLQLVLLHNRYATQFPTAQFTARQSYFRVVHRGPVEAHPLPEGFAFRDADPVHETAEVTGLISRCYRDINLSPATVAAWTQHPVYAADLWVWVVEAATETPVGLGIAELDERVPEASLEWIQVLPAYHRRGIGTALVGELLVRVEGRVAFTTVSGRVDSAANPEALYRRCGFTGDDVWWVLRR